MIFRKIKKGDVVRFSGRGELRLVEIRDDGSVKVKISTLDDFQVVRSTEIRENKLSTTK